MSANIAMTQRNMLKTLLKELPEYLRTYAIAEWLEDINWHTESAMIRKTIPEGVANKIEGLQQVDYIVNPGAYCRCYANTFKLEHPRIVSACRAYLAGETESINTGDQYITASDVYDFKLAKQLTHAMSYTWGWGLTVGGDSWKSDGTGLEFCAELMKLAQEAE